MNLQLVYDSSCSNNKWIVWKKNIYPNVFIHMQIFTEAYIESLMETKDNNSVKAYIESLKTDSIDPIGIGAYTRYPTDTFRNMTISEYLLLGMILRKANTKYNKKKDEFTSSIQQRISNK